MVKWWKYVYYILLPSSLSLAFVIAWPALLVAEHFISPSSEYSAWWMYNVLTPLSVFTLCLRLLNSSKPSLYQQIFGAGVPSNSTSNFIYNDTIVFRLVRCNNKFSKIWICLKNYTARTTEICHTSPRYQIYNSYSSLRNEKSVFLKKKCMHFPPIIHFNYLNQENRSPL